MPTLFVYLPCYNEAGNLRRLTEEWLAEAEALARTGYQLTVIPVDDRSTDDTLAIARQLAQEQARVRVIAHAVNQNLGGVVKTAIGDFLQMSQSGDLMCLMDGDDRLRLSRRLCPGQKVRLRRQGDFVLHQRRFLCGKGRLVPGDGVAGRCRRGFRHVPGGEVVLHGSGGRFWLRRRFWRGLCLGDRCGSGHGLHRNRAGQFGLQLGDAGGQAGERLV